jgi:TP901 family phage tail tape measure protein
MAEENLVTNIVAKSNFSDLIGDLSRVSSKLVSLQQNLNATNKSLAVQAAQMQKSFSDTMRSTGQFSTHFTSVQNDVEKFGRGLDSGRLKLGQYYGAWREHSRTAGGLIRDLARQQVQLQNSVLQPLGKNAQGIMQYAVHVPQGLDAVRNKSALASQELKIMNRVIQDGANQVINWGKNTQWAGRQLSVGLTLPIALFGKTAATAFREADEQLVRLTKVYGGVAATSAQELAKVRKEVAETARDLSAAYGASYKDTIGLAADIAATGKQGEELLKSTREATRLSILGEVDRQDAMKATLSIQTAFKQNTAELAESINFLNAVENQTSTSLADLVEAIPKAGPVVKALGGDVQDLALYLTAMREGGINASEGANALKSALASIINPTKVAKAQFLGFGIDLEGIVSKNAGNLTETILSIQSALDALDPLNKAQAIEQLFGKFQFARMNALFENLGKQGSQTLQVLDLMKTSSEDLANIAGRELSAITESASGKYKRALETLKADLAGVGEQFLNIGTKIINVLAAIIRFFNKLPDPIQKVLTFVAGLTAIAGPIIMLTGLFANFFGYIAKGLFHLRALIKGGEGFKLLTPEIVAAQKAGQLMEGQFYDDAKAAAVLKQAISNLTNELRLLEVKANSARVAVGPAVSTMAGSVIMGGQARIANPEHPLIGRPYSRAFAHLNPVAGMTEQERLGQTIFGVAPNPQPLNQKISNNPQMYMDSDLPRVDRVSSARGFSTGIVAGEAAKWHAMTAALAMQSKEEISLLKSEVAATGAVTTSLSTSYRALLPEMTRITSLAAQEGALIVKQLEAGKLTVDQARAKIIALNSQIEAMMAQSAQMIATQQGRTLSLSTVPLTRQPIVDPITGKSNMKELFHKGPTASLVDQIARNLGVRTSGGGYSIETTMPRVTVAPFLKRNKGGDIETFGPNKTTVSGPSSITYDDRLGSVPLGGYVLNQKASLANPELAAFAPMTYNKGGNIVAELTPQETVFGPGIRAIPGLYEAVDAANRGQNVGGTITPGRRNYGIRFTGKGRSIVDTKTIEKLWRQVFGKRGAAPQAEYEPKGTSGFFGGDVATRLGQKLSTTKLNTLLDKDGVPPNILLASIMSRTSRGRLSTDVFLRGLRDAGTISAAEERRLSRLIFTKYASTIKGMPLVNDRNNPIYSVSDSVIRQELGNIKNRADVERLWAEFSRQPGSFADATRRSSSNFLTSLTAGDKTIKLDKLEGVGKGEKFFHAKSTDNPMYAQLAKMHAEQPFIDKPGGLPASRLAELTSRWRAPRPFYPAGSQYNRIESDPLHGPLFIGKTQRGDFDSGLALNKNIWYWDSQAGKTMLRGYQPMYPTGMGPDAARYATRQYGEGNPYAMGWMEEQKRLGLSQHPLSVSSMMRSLSTPFSGTLFRGIRKGTFEALPKEIQDAIKIAKATGDTKSLIGLEFIMRRSSFSKDPEIARSFATGSDSLMMEARLSGRNVTPMSDLFPDMKFQKPFGQGGDPRSEQEAIAGGKFRIVGFKDGKITVESVDGRAIGGAVSGGTPYVVGERGPEIFVPQSSGKILPNDMYAAGGDIIAGRSAYGVSGNPAKRAQQEAERQARAAAYNTTPAPQPASQPGPLTGSRTTVVGTGGVRTNVYGVQGSLPYMPGLTLGHQTINRMQATLASASQQIGMSIYALGTSIKKDAIMAGRTFSYSAQQLGIGIKMVPDQIKSAIDIAAAKLGSAAGTIVLGIDKIATSTRAAANRFLHMSNPTYAAGFTKNLAYGTSLMMNPFGRRSGTPAGSRMAGMGQGQMAGMATWMGGSIAGGAVGKQAGGETGALVGSIAGPLAIMGVIKLVNSLGKARLAGVALGTSLKVVLGVIGRFIPIIGPLLIIGQALWVWKRRSEDIGKANRAVFGPTEKSLKEVGLKYVALNDRLKDYRQQLELTRAAAASSGQGGSQVSGLTLSVKELKAGIKDAKENAKESVQLFNMTSGKDNVLKLATSLKQQYVSAGMSAQEATNKVYVLMQASKQGMYAIDAISSKSFKSIQDKSTAADYAIRLVATAFKSGETNAQEMSRGVENYVNSIDAYKNSLVGTKDGDKVISQADALKTAMEKILKNKQSTVQIDYLTLSNLKAQNSELGLVLGNVENMASVYAKMALAQSQFSNSLNFVTMTPEESIAIAQGMAAYNSGVEKAVAADPQINKLSKTSSQLAKAYAAASKAAQNFSTVSYEKIIKQQEGIIKQIDKELQLRLKNLDAQEKAASFATNLKKEELNYQKALMSGDMIAAAEAKLNIQQLEKENEIMLARQAIQDAADKKKAAAQKIIDETNAKRERAEAGISSAQKSAESGVESAQAIDVFISKLTSIAQLFGGRQVKDLSQTDRELIQFQLKKAIDDLASSGKQTSEFIKNFKATNMSGPDKGLNYLSGLSRDGEGLAIKEAGGVFKSAVEKFAEAVGMYSSGLTYTYKAPADSEVKDTFGMANQIYMQFKNPKKNTYVQIKADESSVQRYFEGMIAKGYGFVKYMPGGEKGRVGTVYDSAYDAPTVGKAMGGAIPGYADGGSYAPGMGGYIKGRGTPTSDSILLPTGNGGLIRASDTEFMQPASSVSYYGTDFMEDIRARRIPKEIIKAAMGGKISGYPMGGAIPYAMGGAIPGYHEGGPVGHKHKFGNPSSAPSQGSWWDKLGSKMTYKDGVLNPTGTLTFGMMDMIKSLGAVVLGSAVPAFPARERDIASAAETTFVAPVSRLFGSERFPNPWGESGMGMSSGWAKGMDIATVLSAIIPFGFAARTSQQTAANAAVGSVAKTAPKIKIPTPMTTKYFEGDFDDAVGAITKKVMPAKYSMEYDPSGGYHRITVKDGNETAGYLTWNKETGVVENLQVYDGHKGNNIATTMYKHAQTIAPITHSPFRTPAGDAFAYSIGDPVVPLDNNWLPGDWTPGQLEAAAARAAERAKIQKDTGRTGVMPHTKGAPVVFDPLYLEHLSKIGRRPFVMTGGGSSARRGTTKAMNLLFRSLDEGGRLDLLPTPKSFKFTRSAGHYTAADDEIQMHLAIGSKNPDFINPDSPTYLTNSGKAAPKTVIGPAFPTFIHEMGHSWDLGTAGGGRSRSIFMDRFTAKDPLTSVLRRSQMDAWSGMKEGTADWYLHEIFPFIKDKLPKPYLDEYVERLGRSYKSGPGVLRVRDILAPGGKYLKEDGKVAPGRLHQASKDFLSGYLDSNTHLEPEVRTALEGTLRLLEKFDVSRDLLDNNRSAFGYGPETPMRDMLSDRLMKAFEYADMHGLAMGGMIPKFHAGGQVNTKFAGGETLALLKDKEVVFTQDQMTALSSMTSTPNQSVPTSITYAPVINAAPGMDEEMLANLVMVKLGTATNVRYKANGSSGMRVIK